MRVDRNQLDDMLCAAVRAAYEGERVLFEERAHERSIVFHIARHLAAGRGPAARVVGRRRLRQGGTDLASMR